MRTYWRVAPAVALAMIVVLGGSGCGRQPVAIVNGLRITKDEFYQKLEEAAGERVLADLIARKLLEDAFAKSGLQLDEKQVAEEIAKIKKQAPDEATFLAELKRQGMDEAAYTDFVRFQMKVKMLSEKGLNPTEQDLQKEFAKYRQDFDRPATVTLSEIVVSSKEQADKIVAQLKDPKTSFAALARQYSISTYTRERGGRRPEEMQSQVMPEALRGVVANLAVGKVSAPIKVDNNWYIIKVEEKRAAEPATYAKRKEDVRQHYMYTHGKNAQDLITELRKTARVSIMSERYQRLGQLFGPQQALPSFGGGAGGGKADAAPGSAAPAAAGEGGQGH